MTNAQIFDFEREFANSLRCIPMAVRLKLDLCGIKLSLRQWSRFTKADRQELLDTPGERPEDISPYRALVVMLVAARSDEAATPLPEDVVSVEWERSDSVPTGLALYMRSMELAELPAAQWGRLSLLQRFALVKLSRDHHDNINFMPALHEFGLTNVPAQESA